MASLSTYLILAFCCCLVTSNVVVALFITDLVVGFPGNNTVCTGSTTVLTLDGYLSHIDDYLRLRSDLRLFVIVDDEVTEVRRMFGQSILITFRFFGIHTIHARVCHELDCVHTRDPTYVITRPGYGMNHHCSGRMALNLPYINDIPATVTLTGVVVNHLLSNTSFNENGHYIPIAVPSQLSQTSVAVCMIVNGYLILPERGDNYHDRCFVHDNITTKVQIDTQRSFISMLFIEMNSHTVVVRTDFYVVPPPLDEQMMVQPSLSKNSSYPQQSTPVPTATYKNQSLKKQTRNESTRSSREGHVDVCRGLRVVGLYDAVLSEGFYWHDSGLDHLLLMGLVMGEMQRTRGPEKTTICSVKLLVVMDPMMTTSTIPSTKKQKQDQQQQQQSDLRLLHTIRTTQQPRSPLTQTTTTTPTTITTRKRPIVLLRCFQSQTFIATENTKRVLVLVLTDWLMKSSHNLTW